MKSTAAVPASVLLLRGPVRSGTGWGAELGLAPVPALCSFAFSLPFLKVLVCNRHANHVYRHALPAGL